jgi:hypothetical protein
VRLGPGRLAADRSAIHPALARTYASSCASCAAWLAFTARQREYRGIKVICRDRARA